MRRPGEELRWHPIEVQGRRASYGVGGDGPPVVFLHGWALGNHAYKRAMRRLTSRGCRVYAPAMPGFARTADLPGRHLSIAGYAEWVADFMTAIGLNEPVLAIGHSFGGGVAIKLAHDFPERVRYLVLMNSVGGGEGVGIERPPWEWLSGFVSEFFPLRDGVEMLQAMRDDLLTNLVTNPMALLRAGYLAGTADLRAELAALKEWGVPVLALTSQDDGVIPTRSFDALCSAVGTEGRVITGRHSWLLADPDAFGEVVSNVVEVQVAEHAHRRASTTSVALANLLDTTSMSGRRARTLVRDADPVWLMSAPVADLAGDLALCHPRLKRREVRAVARPIDEHGAVRLTIVARDRRGLLADSTAVLASHGLSVSSASAGTWTGLAVHAFTIDHDGPIPDEAWARLGDDLRSMGNEPVTSELVFTPVDLATVEVAGEDLGRSLVRVTAKDQLGLLWVICRWFADSGISIESVRAATEDGVAVDTFLVTGDVDPAALAEQVSRPGPHRRVAAA